MVFRYGFSKPRNHDVWDACGIEPIQNYEIRIVDKDSEGQNIDSILRVCIWIGEGLLGQMPPEKSPRKSQREITAQPWLFQEIPGQKREENAALNTNKSMIYLFFISIYYLYCL